MKKTVIKICKFVLWRDEVLEEMMMAEKETVKRDKHMWNTYAASTFCALFVIWGRKRAKFIVQNNAPIEFSVCIAPVFIF